MLPASHAASLAPSLATMLPASHGASLAACLATMLPDSHAASLAPSLPTMLPAAHSTGLQLTLGGSASCPSQLGSHPSHACSPASASWQYRRWYPSTTPSKY
ncbi:hypothetical protein KXX65_006989 [Aspergillus fumigatus]|nr:hypothetical protein KXX65_006989 [Aspergillus fumigatus]KAH2946505.1 hypothetical protein KXW00_006758 [Aspergillus fumigatus]